MTITRTVNRLLLAAAITILACPTSGPLTSTLGQESQRTYLDYVRDEAARARSRDVNPATANDWARQREELRTELLAAWGGFPSKEAACALEARKLGELVRDGYRVEKIVFQTLPGVWMTANAYVPEKAWVGEGRKPEKVPAVLCVHGHWRGAKQDPVVQSRCIGLAKLGFFVLVVDALGAGERAIGKALGEYHGEMTGALLLPIGKPLSGVQVYENTRAIDYLQSRPEVDPSHIGVTGASGGGNQSMYVGAWDNRLGAVVPVCSVGTYQAYLGAACCMCEVVPGALRFTEESRVLALTSPRALMVVNATRDAFQFSVGEAAKSLESARGIFDLHASGHSRTHLKHSVFESGHDYSKVMRETVYGWMTHHLKGAQAGDGSPIAEPEIKTETPEDLRCFPGETRPDDYMTIPRFAAREGQKLVAQNQQSPKSASDWLAESGRLKKVLLERTLGGDPGSPKPPNADGEENQGMRTMRFSPETGLRLTARYPANDQEAPLALVLDLEGADQAVKHPLAQKLGQQGWRIASLTLRATGPLAPKSDKVGNAPDHNSAEWALWLGRPLLGQWVVDVKRFLDQVEHWDGKLPKKVAVVGLGPAGVVALCSAAADPRVTSVVTSGTLSTYISDQPYRHQRLGIMAPGIVRDIGDIPKLAALVAPRQVVVVDPVSPTGQALSSTQAQDAFLYATNVWELLGAETKFSVLDSSQAAKRDRLID